MARFQAKQIRAMLTPVANIGPALLAAADIIEDCENAERSYEDLTRNAQQRKATLDKEIEERERKLNLIGERLKERQKQEAEITGKIEDNIKLIQHSQARAQAEHDIALRNMETDRKQKDQIVNGELRKLQDRVNAKLLEERDMIVKIERLKDAQAKLVVTNNDLDEKIRRKKEELKLLAKSVGATAEQLKQNVMDQVTEANAD